MTLPKQWVWLGINTLLMAATAQNPSMPILSVPQGHSAGRGVRALAVNPASTWFATLGNDETLCVWNSADGQFLAKAPAKDIRSIAVLPKSHLAVLGDAQGGVRLMDVDTFSTVNTGALGASVEWLQSTADGRIFAVTYKGLYRLDPGTLAASRVAEFGSHTPYRLAMNEDGSMIAIVFSQLGGADRLAVYATADGAKKLERDVPRAVSVAISGDMLAIGSRDSDDIRVLTGHVLVLRVRDGSVLGNVAMKNAPQSLLLRPDAEEIVFGLFGRMERLSLSSGKTLEGVDRNETLTELSMQDGRLIAVGSKGIPSLCDAATLRCKSSEAVQGLEVTQAQTLKDERLLLMGSNGDAIVLGDSVERNSLYLEPTLALVSEFKGERGVFAIGKTDDAGFGGQVNSALSPVSPPDLLSLASPVTLAASREGHFLASRKANVQSRSFTVAVYDLSGLSNEPLAAPPEWTEWTLDAESPYTTDASSEFQFAFTSDAKLLTAVDVFTGSIHRYDLANRKELMPFLHGRDQTQADPNGPGFVSAWTLCRDDRTVVLGWYDSVNTVSVDSGAVGQRVKLQAAIGTVVGGDGGGAFIGLKDGTLLTWDGQGQPRVLAKLEFAPRSLLYVQDRNLLIVNSGEGSIHILDAKNGEERMGLALFANGTDWLVWTPTGMFDASDRGWRGVKWKATKNTFAPAEPVEDFIDDFEIPGLAGLVLAGLPPKPPVLRTKERRIPTVQVTAAAVTAGGKVNLRIEVIAPAGVAIENVHVSRNGVLLKVWSGKQVSGAHLDMTADVVAGDNQFTAYAFNQDDLKSVDATAEVTGPESLRRTGELYVVAVGVNEYRNQAFALNYARQDALLAAGVLAAQRKEIESLGNQVLAQEAAEGKPRGVSYDRVDLRYSLGNAHVTTLVDGQATREAILKTIADVSHRARPEDTIVVYYAGHGVAVGDRYYLLPQDFAFAGQPAQVRTSGLDALKRSAISDLDLQKALEGEQAAVSAIILDACQSGEVLGETPARRGPMNSRGLAQMAYDKRMYILAASLSTQSAKEQAALEHGVLTYALVEEGLAEDLASPERNMLQQGGLTTLPQWLRWGAQRVGHEGTGSASRGITVEPDSDQAKQARQRAQANGQQPRLFAPPDEGIQVAVALRAIPFDPKTFTATGYTQETAPAKVHATPDNLLYRASTLGSMRPGTLRATASESSAAVGGKIVTVDLDHGAVVSRNPIGGTLLSYDLAANGELVAMDQSGNVLLKAVGDAAAHVVVPGFGWSGNGLVRWIGDAGKILVVTDKGVAVHTREGTKVVGVEFPATGMHGPVVSAKGDWVYLADWSGKVLSYQLPSLNPGLAWENATRPPPSGPIQYVTSLVTDPSGRHLLRIMNDGSFSEARLPSLTPEPNPFAGVHGMYAATWSSDGKTLFVADTGGQVDSLDSENGTVNASWPSRLDHADALAIDPEGDMLVASGNGGLTAWHLPEGALRTSVPGGGYFATAHFAGPATLNVMLSSRERLRTFSLPGTGLTSDVAAPKGLFVSGNRMMGNGLLGKTIWDPADARKAAQVPLSGDGRAALTPDGSFLAWVGSQARPQAVASIEVYRTASGTKLREVKPQGQVSAFTLSNDGRTVAYSVGDQLLLGDAPAVNVPQMPCCVMTLSPAADRLLAASNMGEVMLYDVAAKRIERRQQTEYVLAAAEFSPGGDRVVLVSDSGTVLVWNRTSAEEPRLVGSVGGAPMGIAFNAAGSEFVVSTDSGEIGWFSLMDGGAELATSTWLEATESWLTIASDGRFTVSGDANTPLGSKAASEVEWKPASKWPGFTPGLLQELLAK